MTGDTGIAAAWAIYIYIYRDIDIDIRCIPMYSSPSYEYLVAGLEQFYDFPFSWECHHTNWRTLIFQRGGSTTNQIWSCLYHFPYRHHMAMICLPFSFPASWNTMEPMSKHHKNNHVLWISIGFHRFPKVFPWSSGGGPGGVAQRSAGGHSQGLWKRRPVLARRGRKSGRYRRLEIYRA